MRNGRTLLCTGILASSATAQDLSLFAGTIHARYADSITGTAASGSLRIEARGSRSHASAEVGLAAFSTGELTQRAAVSGSVILHASPAYSVALSGLGTTSGIDGSDWTGTAQIGPAVLLPRDPWFASVAMQTGPALDIDENTFAVTTAHARLVRVIRGGAIESGLAVGRAGPNSWFDASLGASLTPTTLDAAAILGLRTGDLSGAWFAISGAKPFSGTLTLELQAGRYPEDYLGFTEGLYASAGLRVALRRATPPPWAVRNSDDFSVNRVADGVRVALRIDARAVMILGDWDDWTEHAMSRDGDQWVIVLPLSPGVHEFVLVVDGERVVIPGIVPRAPDGMGGEVGILLVH